MKNDPWRRQPGAYALQGTLQPRFTDVDMWQHINNVAQIGLHGEVLQQWLRSALGSDPWRRTGPQLAVCSNATDFLAEAQYPAPLATGARLLGVDADGFSLGTALFQEGTCVGLHQTRLGGWQGGRPAPLPADWLAALHAAQAAQPALPDGAPVSPEPAAPPTGPAHADAWPWQITIGSRFADGDGQGHASDFTLARCAEQGRVQFLTRVFGSEDGTRSVGFMVAHVALRWLHRSRAPAAWQLGIGVGRVGERSLAVRSALFDGPLCVAESNSVMVVIDHSTRRPAALPDATRAQLAQYQLPGA